MKHLYLLFFALFILTFAEAQNNAAKTTAEATETEERLVKLEKEVSIQQQTIDKQKATLNVLKEDNIELKAYKEGYSDNITVLTWVFGTFLAIGLAVVGFIIPNYYKRESDKAIEIAKTEFDKLISDLKEDLKKSLSEAEARTMSLEENIFKETKGLKLQDIANGIFSDISLMLISRSGLPESDAPFGSALSVYQGVINFALNGGTNIPTTTKDFALKNIEEIIKKPIKKFNDPEMTIKQIQELINKETDENYIRRLNKIDYDYKKLYYGSIDSKEGDVNKEII